MEDIDIILYVFDFIEMMPEASNVYKNKMLKIKVFSSKL